MGEMTIVADRSISEAVASGEDDSSAVRMPMAPEWWAYVDALTCRLTKTPDSIFTAMVALYLSGVFGLEKVSFSKISMRKSGIELDGSVLLADHTDITSSIRRLPPTGGIVAAKAQRSDEVRRMIRIFLHRNSLRIGAVKAVIKYKDGDSFRDATSRSETPEAELADDFAYFRALEER